MSRVADSNDPFLWTISEALQELGLGVDSKTLADRIRRLQAGLPSEDEFSVLLTWLGRCRLVHKLDQLQSPRDSRARLRVPDLLAVFDYRGSELPVLIEVKTSAPDINTLSWAESYRDSLVRYAEMLKLPLLVAWKCGSMWTLTDVRQMTPSPIR